jgi:hypothetical protein
MKLSTSDADVASAKGGKCEGVLEQASQRKSPIVALHSYDSHEIRKHPHRCFRAINLGLGRQLVRAGRSKIDAVARALGQDTGFFGSLAPMIWVIEVRGNGLSKLHFTSCLVQAACRTSD